MSNTPSVVGGFCLKPFFSKTGRFLGFWRFSRKRSLERMGKAPRIKAAMRADRLPRHALVWAIPHRLRGPPRLRPH